MVDHAQGTVVWCCFNFQQSAHQRINVDAVKGLRCEVLFEVRPKSPENGLHVHLLIAEAMITFVDVDDESLMGQMQEKTDDYLKVLSDTPVPDGALIFSYVVQTQLSESHVYFFLNCLSFFEMWNKAPHLSTSHLP